MFASRPILFPAAIIATLSLAACNSGPSAPVVAAQPQAASASPSTTLYQGLPSGAGCSSRIEAYNRMLENDLKTGHVGKNVYETIQKELEQASSLCKGGRDAEASAAVTASRKSHGYPPG
jgi:hypothetical protein